MGVSMDQRLGLSMVREQSPLVAPLAAALAFAVVVLATSLPSASRMRQVMVQSAADWVSFWIVVFTATLAEASVTWGVVT